MTRADDPPLPAWFVWTAVFVANLPLPLLLGLLATADGGWPGMLAAVAAMWAAGVAAVQVAAVRPILIVGGAMVAVTQVIPVLHSLAAVVGFAVWEQLSGERFFDDDTAAPPMSALCGFVVTVVVGGLLLLVAAACGTVVRLVVLWRRNRSIEE